MSRLEPVDGTSIIDDIRLGHTLHELSILTTFILQQNPSTFIEIGVHEGGLSYVLLPILKCEYIGVEINCAIVREKVKKLYKSIPNANLCCMDCFGFECYEIVSSKQNKIIYCDGGNKPKELRHFMGACASGDIIMAHDFYDGKRKVLEVETLHPEVTIQDAKVLDDDPTFIRLDEDIFRETRIVGWIKI